MKAKTRRSLRALLPLTLSMALVACQSISEPNTNPQTLQSASATAAKPSAHQTTQEPLPMIKWMQTPAYSDEVIFEQPGQATPRAALWQLTRQLHQNLQSEAGGRLSSPVSLWLALGLCAQGEAHPDPALLQALGVEDSAELSRAATSLLQNFKYAQPDLVADQIGLAHPQEQWASDYLDRVGRAYQFRPGYLDLQHPQAYEAINAYIKEQTNGRLDPFYTEPLEPLDLLLLQILTFQGTWNQPFSADAVVQDDFHVRLPDGTRMKHRVDYLQAKDYKAFMKQASGWQWIQIDYTNGLSAIIALPEDEQEPLNSASQRLYQYWAEHPDELQGGLPVSVDLKLPRFEMIARHDLLKQLNQPPYQSLLNLKEPVFLQARTPLRLSTAQQMVRLTVDEKGTRAEAATAIGVAKSEMFVPAQPLQFHVTRPFLFVLTDGETPLFVAEVEQPVSITP